MPAHSYERLDDGADSSNATVFEVPSELQIHGDDENDNLHNHAINDHANEELDHLVDAFDGSSDSDIDDSDWDDDRQIDQSDSDDIVDTAGASTSAAGAVAAAASSSASSHATPSQPPARRSLFNFLPWRSSGSPGRTVIRNQNDGVFSNITAKPETDGQSEDFPPTYEEASSDQAPPYWETTIMTPGFGDEIFIEGLPVGSPINFVWNMMVSSAFQFVGFLLTYLLHTSHAAKQGSRAGLGFTLFQYGFYLKPNAAGDSTAPAKEFEPSRPNDYEISSTSQDMSGSFHQDAAASGSSSSIDSTTPDPTTGWVSIFLIVLGGIIIVKALLDYAAVRKMEQVIEGRSSSTTAPIEEEEDDDTRSDRSVRV